MKQKVNCLKTEDGNCWLVTITIDTQTQKLGRILLHNCNSGDYKLLSTLCGSCSCSCFCFGCCGYMRGQRALLLKSKVLQCKSICSLATHKLVEKIRTFKQQTLAKCCSKSQKIKSAKDKEKTMKNKEKRRI